MWNLIHFTIFFEQNAISLLLISISDKESGKTILSSYTTSTPMIFIFQLKDLTHMIIYNILSIDRKTLLDYRDARKIIKL